MPNQNRKEYASIRRLHMPGMLPPYTPSAPARCQTGDTLPYALRCSHTEPTHKQLLTPLLLWLAFLCSLVSHGSRGLTYLYGYIPLPIVAEHHSGRTVPLRRVCALPQIRHNRPQLTAVTQHSTRRVANERRRRRPINQTNYSYLAPVCEFSSVHCAEAPDADSVRFCKVHGRGFKFG